jgi:protein-disulfide isomerase
MFSLNLYPSEDNPLAALSSLVKVLRLRITQGSLREFLHNHPDYPSLFSMAEALRHFGVEQGSLRISADQLKELDAPFVAHLHTRGGLFVTVTQLSTNTVTYTDGGQSHQLSRDEFIKKWSGVVLLAEATEQSGEADYRQKYQSEVLSSLRLPFIISTLAVMLGYAMYLSPSWQLASTMLLKAIGAAICVLILAVQYGKTNALTASLCNITHKTDCNHLLTSPAAKITSWLGWSEVGLIYFLGGLLYLLSNQGKTDFSFLLWAIGSLALPFTFWSLYYQGRVAKQWCTLCLGIVALLWLETIPMFSIKAFSFGFSNRSLLSLLSCFGFAALAWYAMKPLLLKAQQAESYQKELRKFKNNPALFEAMLHQQRQMPLITEDIKPLILGNPQADHTITMVTNPYCGPCAKAHIELEEALVNNPNIKAQIIFTACDGVAGRISKVSGHLLSLNSEQTTAAGLLAWYQQKNKDYDTWAAAYPLAKASNEANIVAKHCSWTQAAHITGTPTFFVNGYELPRTVYGLSHAAQLMTHLDESNFSKTDLREST